MVYDKPKISDYALIGNCCSAALVSNRGSIDWCCLPEFDSPGIFAALLDREKGGFFSIAPAEKYTSAQKYLSDSNVVETHFTTNEGSVKLTDAFTAMTEENKLLSLFPDQEILRIVEGVSGTIKMKLEYFPRIFYGERHCTLSDHKKLGIHFSWKENVFILVSTLDPEEFKVRNDKSEAASEFYVRAGERVIFSLSYSCQSPAVIPELKKTAELRIENTIKYWRNWISTCKYSGFYHEHVKRSALALKLLTHAPSGSIIAAPTTSLPETIGGERNWDYRYCWLRDASFTTRALVKLGFHDEAHAYLSWILHATRLTQPELQTIYSIYGLSSLHEESLDWLSGYKNSRPVRIGNKAEKQFQLDVYGEVLDAVYAYSPLVKEFDTNSKKFVIGLGNEICKVWNQPDNGIWEVRAQRVHHTHSKVLAWAGLDRLIKLCQKYEWQGAPLEKFQKTAAMIRETIERLGYNEKLRCYTRELRGQNVDASLLTLSLVGYCDHRSPRMLSTVDRICEQLSSQNLIYRYRNVDDGLEGNEEGSFAICNFWLAENLAHAGRAEEAIKVFESTVQHASPAGLLSEQIDTRTHELLGNYPQGFTHIGLINAALSIDEVLQKKYSHAYS